MDFHRLKNNAKPIKIVFRFPFGFDGDDQAARHEDLVRYLQVRSMRTAQQRPPSVNSKRFRNVQSVLFLMANSNAGGAWGVYGP